MHLPLLLKKGDSGGPLVQKGSDTTGANDVLMGIVSWGVGCADESFPGGTSCALILVFLSPSVCPSMLRD